MARDIKSYARSRPKYRENPRILIICEDSKSCLDYLEQAKSHFRAHADVRISHCGKTDPLGIVEEAIKNKKAYSEVYCAIDRDTHKNFDEAVDAAKASNVNLIVSYPCYEFWLLLHFKKTRKTHSSVGKKSAADRLLEVLCREDGMAEYKKGVSKELFASLLPRLPEARTNALWAMDQAEKEESLDPSTRIHELIALFEKIGDVIPVDK